MDAEAREPRDAAACAGIFLLFLVVYGLSATRWMAGADSGEFATLSVSAGVAHPPGYPLYTMYLRSMSWLPGISPAHTSALATAILGAATVTTLFAALRRWSLSIGAAAGAALIVGLDTQVWNLHTHAEVFALNNLIAAAIIWAAAPLAPRRGLARAATLGMLAGLGLANHHSIVLIAPLGLYGIWLALREAGTRLRATAAFAAAVVAGLLGLFPYAYLAITAQACDNCLQWGVPDHVSAVWSMFTRADYGTTSLGIGGERLPLPNLLAMGKQLLSGTLGVAVVLSVVGIVRWRKLEVGKLGGAAVLASALLAGPVFATLFNIAPEGIGADIVARFYALPLILLTPLIGAGLSIGARTPVLAAALAMIVGLTGAPRVIGSHTDALENYAHDMLVALPQDAILVGTGDHRMFGAHYQQLALGFRTDVVYVDGRLLAHRWYEERIERRAGVDLPSSSETDIPIFEVLGALAASGRPVFVTHLFFEELAKVPTYPWGVTLRLADGTPPPPPRELARMNADLFAEFAMQTGPGRIESAWELEVFDHYARTWDSLAMALKQQGDSEGAERARAFATLFTVPTSGD